MEILQEILNILATMPADRVITVAELCDIISEVQDREIKYASKRE